MSEWIIIGERLHETSTKLGKRPESYFGQTDSVESSEQEQPSNLPTVVELQGGFQVWCWTNIDWERNCLTYHNTLHHNSVPLRVVGKGIRLQVARLLNKLNGFNRYGSFYLDFHTGCLHFRSRRCFTVAAKSCLDNNKDVQPAQPAIKIAEQDLRSKIDAIDLYINEILEFSNLNKLKYNGQWGKLTTNPKSLRSLERVNQYLTMTDINLNQILEGYVSQQLPSHIKLDMNSMERIYNVVSDSGVEQLRRQIWSFTTYSDYLEIEGEVADLKWNQFYSGQTYAVSKAVDVRIYAMRNKYPETYGPDITRNLIRKVEHISPPDSVRNEQHVYQFLNSYTRNPNIIKPIYCKHSQDSSFIVQECNGISLQRYLQQRSETCSLQTKLHILILVAKGLRALYIRNILYLNLKPSNLIISKELNCQLNDMSKAIVLKTDQEDAPVDVRYTDRFGMAAPQLVTRKYCQKTDVYFMGKLMLEVLLDIPEMPLDRMLKLQSDGLLPKPLISPELVVCREMALQHFPSTVSEQIMELCWKCVSVQPQNRPRLEWIIAILSEIKSSLQFEL